MIGGKDPTKNEDKKTKKRGDRLGEPREEKTKNWREFPFRAGEEFQLPELWNSTAWSLPSSSPRKPRNYAWG